MFDEWLIWVSVASLGLIAMYICHSERPRSRSGMFRRDVVLISKLPGADRAGR